MAAEVSTSEAAGHGSWVEGMSADNIKGLVLAISSSFFIGASFIVKKKGLKKAGASGVRAGDLIPSLPFPYQQRSMHCAAF
jgi:magnesium transporter